MRLHALQYLRAVAALAVVYSHAAIQVDGYAPYLSKAGSFGVDIFFVISGFIMIYIAKPDTQAVPFFINRIRRVVPLYWFFILLMAAILLLRPDLFKATAFQWDSVIMSLAFIPHWSVAQEGVVWPIVAPGWSLNFEMYFYLVFALSLFLTERYRVLFITLIISAVFLVAQYFDNGESALAQFYGKSMVFEFVFGMLLAVAWKRGFRLPASTAVFLLILGSCLLFMRLPVPRIFEFGVPSLLIVTACLFVRVKEYRWAVLLGDASYALYLSHIFTLGILRKVLAPLLGAGPIAAYLFVIISIIVCTLVSLLIHKYVDNWLLRHERFASQKMPQPSKA
ncbi:MAG: acyltransferase family protein [Granulosicoccus sp.]